MVVQMSVRVSRASEGGMAKVLYGLSEAAGEKVAVVLMGGTGAAVVGLVVGKAEHGAGVVAHGSGVAMSGQQCCPCWPSSRCMAMS